MSPRALKSLFFFIFAFVVFAADRLHPGDLLPDLTGQTLSGKPITISGTGNTPARVVIFSFTHPSAGDSRLWIDRVTTDAPAGKVEVYQAIELESAPRLVRGMAASGIRSATPAPQWEHTVLLYKQEAEWKTRLGVADDKYAYIVLTGEADVFAGWDQGPSARVSIRRYGKY